MDATGASPRRLQVAVELFVEGKSLVYEGVVFWKDKAKAVHIYSYTEWEPENTTPVMAQQKIQRAKLVLAELCSKSVQFQQEVASLPHEHYFCYDYGTGSFSLAKEAAGVFEWHHPRPSNG